jgi:hypothetical protein
MIVHLKGTETIWYIFEFFLFHRVKRTSGGKKIVVEFSLDEAIAAHREDWIRASDPPILVPDIADLQVSITEQNARKRGFSTTA